MQFDSDIRRQKLLEETRLRNPDRPVKIDSVTGCVVVGATLEERLEVCEMMDEDQKQGEEQLRNPKHALNFIRNIDDADEPVFGSRIRKVLKVFHVQAKVSFRESGASIIALVRPRHGKARIVVAGESHYPGTMMDPPDYDASIDELKCPKIKPRKGQEIKNNGCGSTNIVYDGIGTTLDGKPVDDGYFKCLACGLEFNTDGDKPEEWDRQRR